MAAFDPDADQHGDPAYSLMADTPVIMFWRTQLLDDAVAGLTADRYEVVSFDSTRWESAADLHTDVAVRLGFPDYYGRNLDALNDCLRDVVAQRYGWPPEAVGLVLVFTGYDAFARREPRVAQIVLDIVAVQSRQALLVGLRLMCLVQSDDPKIGFEPVGALPVMWNDAEWLDANRR